MPTKDIFGNPIKQNAVKQMSYTQKLKEAKAKQKYQAYQKEQRRIQIENVKASAQRSKQGLQKVGNKVKSGYKRATSNRLTSLREKFRGSIYKKE